MGTGLETQFLADFRRARESWESLVREIHKLTSKNPKRGSPLGSRSLGVRVQWERTK